ncbi:uncharacterized protein LOC114759232 [Neltuma alba]|uniref:uncharacterized protein LOC114759232 n=1 Tax=Neltuma alba TaxID=207710 RepID=UPI0010A38EE2|nr:uncharacterized protein LOC114759232 [Prosopis alba]
MRISLAGFRSSLPFSGLISSCQSLVIEHKFSAKEICEAKATVYRAVANWKRNASLEERNIGLKK